MNTAKILNFSTRGFIFFSALCLLWVSLMAIHDPASVMALVSVELSNNDAVSSIRGAYGGVGLTLFIALCYMMVRDKLNGLRFLCILWGAYALSRITTILVEGALGDFGRQWLFIESALCTIALVLMLLHMRSVKK